jgi:predicted TIM-barrel fold metal-dependent hydrolase
MTRDSRKPLGLDDVFIVDCDVHANEPPEALAPYIDMPWRRSLELLGRGPQRYLDIPGYAPILNLDPPFPDRGLGNRTVTSARQMRDELDELSIDVGILFPDNLLKIAVFPHVDYAAALGRAYNAWLADAWVSRETGLYGAVLAVPQDPKDAAEQIRTYGADDRFVAVYLPVAGLRPLWGDRMYDPIYEAAEEMGLPVMLHSVGIIHPHFPFNLEHVESRIVRHPINHEFALMANLFTMIANGVPVRYPDLEIVFTEGGVSWVPFVMWRMDKEYQALRHEAPFLRRLPSAYVRDHVRLTTQPIEEPPRTAQLVQIYEMVDAARTLLFASDYPHFDFDSPAAVSRRLPRSMRPAILHDNAARLYGLGCAGAGHG